MANIVIYTKTGCPYCVRAKMLLTEKQQGFKEVCNDNDTERRQHMLELTGGQSYTVPQIFINDQLIGGCSDLEALNAAGKLDALLGA
ncbi:glutaredoxin 3 [Gallaecimonas xiamenensis]|uniref:Glutaredoxin n=1 Tax=Gallaecimonas xiamenensis 3-C-1 TaxID=745411 RepID=K2JD60_9GAMM|nr:glutaredoxin 3 [Gallaecimonas xiamenensis]EKE73043.1 glutaredoxin 3 [Gallaecimonas xiamenensis 3-C-1]